jgi:hypothetical protein
MADTKPPCLTVLGGPMAGNRFVLEDGVANILIGSDPVCAFHLPLPGVSAMHARLSVEPAGVSIWEAGSPRGLHVNDSRVETSATLRNGDIVWLGTPGDADVVMLQVILPRLPSLVAGASADAAAEEAAAEAAAAEAAAEAAALEAAAAEAAAVEGETVALDPSSLSLDSGAPAAEPEAEPVPVPDDGEPMAIPFDSPLDAHFANVAPTGEPEEAGLVVEAAAEPPVDMSSATLIAGPDVMAGHDFVLADEGLPLTVQEPASPFVPPPAPAAPKARIATPPGFEDETEDRLVEAEPEAQTLIVRPAPHEIEPPAALAESDFTMPPVPSPVAPARVTPPAPTPPPTPAPAAPAPVAKPATPPVRPARPAAPSTPPARKPAGPSVSQRTEPAERPAAAAPARAKSSSSSTGLYVGLGLGALVVLGGGAFAVMKMMGGKAPAVAQATPPPVTPTAAPTQAPVATPPPVVEATPEPAGAATPAPVTPTPTPAATPTARPTPSPSPTKPGATPTPTPAATPAGPSPEQVRAQQVAGLLGQAEAAMGARQYDQAVARYDDVLKLDPGNAKAASERGNAVAARDAARKRFVPGRTVVTTEKASGGGLSGFEGAAVQKAPDFLGRIEFEMSPASGLKAGDPWTLKLFVVNEGKKAIRITDLTATTVVNGERSGGAGAKAREIAPQARAQVGEMAGTWKEGTQTWSAEVLLTAKGDSLKNTLTWR